MVFDKSLDPYRQIIAALLCDVQTLHSEVFTIRAQRLTTQKVMNRLAQEGLGFLTKTLPRLGKALDRALTGEVVLDANSIGFATYGASKLPRFLGELFECVFSHDGWILPIPSAACIKTLREVLFVFYKLELPYSSDQELTVIQKFLKTDEELAGWNESFRDIAKLIVSNPTDYDRVLPGNIGRVVRIARRLLSDVFSTFDPLDIHPRHGPGAVSTGERLSEKYLWTEISPRIIASYPLDAYFFASNGHVCDELIGDSTIKFCDNSAKVILVPKDSRGPRLISCEPLDFQWIQQGLGRAIVRHVEAHPLTRYAVHFTDQSPNQIGALWGSKSGRYATLDLNEASDRVSIGLVRLLFPEHLTAFLMNCRSQTTIVPSGDIVKLNKFAPMGSALCFPVLALTCWAILSAGLSDAASSELDLSRTKREDLSEKVLVYGDDVVVPSAQAENAMTLLEAFGLKINRDKSCTTGFFRESCGVDAYRGIDVTPVRVRTVWSHTPSPDTYVSYIAYANAMYKRQYYETYECMKRMLIEVYDEIPDVDMNLSCPSLIGVPEDHRPKRRRTHSGYQKLQWYVRDVKSPMVTQVIGGWQMLLRFFAETSVDSPLGTMGQPDPADAGRAVKTAFSVSSYTERRTSRLVRRWR